MMQKQINRASVCKRGHEWTPENTYVSPKSGARNCRSCQAIATKRYQTEGKLPDRGERLCSVKGCTRPHLAQDYCIMHYSRYKTYGDPLKTKLVIPARGEIQDYFHSMIKLETDECIEWKYSRNIHQYGHIIYKGKKRATHRLALLLTVGEPPDDKPHVLHSCDNPPCFNPRHLRYGTYIENSQDMINSGHSGKGSKNARARLNEEQVRRIKQDTRSDLRIAADYGVSDTCIYSIRKGISWKHI